MTIVQYPATILVDKSISEREYNMDRTQAAHLLVNLFDTDEGINSDAYNVILESYRTSFGHTLDFIFIAADAIDGWFFLDHEQALGIHEMIDQGA